ncbi:MAG: pirin family protein [Ilumatobacter sp.]|uniref:pirin family protein n=1 Tax=Ilumatobacter sp. TaxID=1967498 RepID=UPI003299EAC6
METAIELRIDPRHRPVGSSTVRRLLPFRERRMVGPFIFADLIGPEELADQSSPNIDAHPHIGLATVTYLLDGRMVHRDSTGAVATIEPGDVNWMTAGSGVTHTERAHPDDANVARSLHGLQTWVALPDTSEEAASAFEHADADALPTETVGRSRIHLAVGTGWGMESSVVGASPLVLADVRLDADSPVPISTTHAEIAVLSVDGDIAINHERIEAGQLAVLDTSRELTLSGSGTAIVLGGDPVGKRHMFWNFVHSDEDRIEQAKADWIEQRFPTVPGDHEPYVPLPGQTSPSPASTPTRTD